MSQTEIQAIKSAIEATWQKAPSVKAERYIGKFFARTRTERKIAAKVPGNYGIYTVSIEAKPKAIKSACSCYIGKGGFCHHCDALAYTFLQDEESFQVAKLKPLQQVHTLDGIETYLRGNTLDSLIQDLKAGGMNQKEFAKIIGMNPRHLSAIKSSELRNRYYNELGATKLACIWVIEHLKK